MSAVAGKGRIHLVPNLPGQASFLESWAEIAASAGYDVSLGREPETDAKSVDLLLIEGPVPAAAPLSRHVFLIDDGSPPSELAGRLRQVPGSAILCCDADRVGLLTAERLPARALTPGLQPWRWTRPVRPPEANRRIVVATDAPAGRLPGLVTLPLPGGEAGAAYGPSVQAVVLVAPERHLFHALTALATGLPLVLPPGGLRWLGPLAALRWTVEETPDELMRLAKDRSAWFDQVSEGMAALKRSASPARFLEDISGLFDGAGRLPKAASAARSG